MELKMGCIGCGGNGAGHIGRLVNMDNVKIVATCDIDKDKAEKSAELCGCKAYTDHHIMFDDVEMDACLISIPPFAHTDHELICIEKNIPFLVEKPQNLYLEKAVEIAEKVKEKGLITSVGYVLRYYSTADKAKELLQNKKIALLRGKYYGCVPAAGKGWYCKKDLSGGQLIEQATHTVDMMRYLGGDVDEVYTYVFEGINNQKYSGYDVEDVSTTLMKFKNGAVGNVTCTWLWQGYESEVEVLTDSSIVKCQPASVEVREVGKENVSYEIAGNGCLEEDRVFVEAVLSGDPSKIKSDYADGLKSLAVSICAYKSAREGRPVKVEV